LAANPIPHDGPVPDRKRHIGTDILGLLLIGCVTAAIIGDRDAAVGLPPPATR
jgi:hypothetical protein